MSYNEVTFQQQLWTDFTAQRPEPDDSAKVCGEYTWEAGEYGEGQVAVKIVDVLDEEWFGVLNAE